MRTLRVQGGSPAPCGHSLWPSSAAASGCWPAQFGAVHAHGGAEAGRGARLEGKEAAGSLPSSARLSCCGFGPHRRISPSTPSGEYYAAVKRREPATPATMWTELGHTTPSDRRRRGRSHGVRSHLHEMSRTGTSTDRKWGRGAGGRPVEGTCVLLGWRAFSASRAEGCKCCHCAP